jgi:hypothetical protein
LSELQATLTCECGKSHIATEKNAGSQIPCGCGRLVAVPTLSKLRTQAGKDAYVTNPAEAIRKHQRESGSPAGDRCILCGSTSPIHYTYDAVCESSRLKAASSDQSGTNVFWIMLVPGVIRLIRRLVKRCDRSTDAVRVGHDIEVSFDLPVCDACTRTAGDMTRPRVSKELMRRVPLYNDLLAYYPNLTLTVRRHSK